MPSDESLDAGIARIVQTLQEAGVETFESCQGGEGHVFPRPTVRFRGTRSCGFVALGIALKNCWPVESLSRLWTVVDGEVTGPYWEIVFRNIRANTSRER